MLTVKLGSSVMEVDVMRFHFGDGEWVVTIYGNDLFS
jgi:hypothetical protein